MKRILALVAILAAFTVSAHAGETIPYCTEEQLDAPGADTLAEAQADAAAAADDFTPECQVNPADVVTVEGGGEPIPMDPLHQGSDYHWLGFSTREFLGTGFDFEGAQITVQAKNIDNMPHDSDQDFVANRVMVIPDGGSNWLEVGWVEHDDEGTNTQQFTYTHAGGANWSFYNELVAGTYYTYRLRAVGDTMKAERLNNNTGDWVLLTTVNRDCTPDNCAVEAFTEVHVSDVDGAHPTWNGTIRFQQMKIDTSGSSFPAWSDTGAPSTVLADTAGYSACSVTEWTVFESKRNAC